MSYKATTESTRIVYEGLSGKRNGGGNVFHLLKMIVPALGVAGSAIGIATILGAHLEL